MMSENDKSLEESLFESAVQKPSRAECAAFLDNACHGNPTLRAQLDELLEGHFGAAGFLPKPAAHDPLPVAGGSTPTAAAPGQVIGRYKLLEKIGEGTFGEVWMAEQFDPVKRRVALKILKLGMDTRQVVARFEAERQALALMDHANIAKVLDGGATDSGRPYLVMELVRGIKFTEYCDEKRLPMCDRLNLFITVCQAIQHAHQKGIIHRDIKPSNILVAEQDGAPCVKVIDFGIAKAIDQELTDKTLFTRFQQLIGTPAYMSPEQAGSQDIDTRTDIYSLGALLYELLTGHPPFETRELLAAGVDEMRRTLREKEPLRPSTRVSTLREADRATVANYRQAQPAKLCTLLRGDLDWVVMRALEKDRSRRYETAASLGVDIQKYLTNEPVSAGPPSHLYRLGKAIHRNKLAFGAAAAIALALIGGVVASTWQALRAKRAEKGQAELRNQAVAAEREARIEAAKSREVARFLEQMLAGVGPSAAKGRDTQMLREILSNTAGRIAKDLQDQPAVAAELRNTLATVYFDLGDYKEAEVMHLAALDQARRAYGSNHVNIAASFNNLALALQKQNRLSEAEGYARKALDMRTGLVGRESVEVSESLSTLGSVFWMQQRYAEAETNYLASVALARKLEGNKSPRVAAGLGNLGNLAAQQGKLSEAEDFFHQALDLQRKLFGDESLEVTHTLDSLGNTLSRDGKKAEAEHFLREALAVRRKILDSDHPELAFSLNNLAEFLRAEGKLAEAESLHREAVTIRRKRLGNNHPYLALSLNNLGGVLWSEGKLTEAEAACRESLSIRRKAFGDMHLDVAQSLNTLGNVLKTAGKLKECETARREAVMILKRIAAPDSPDLDTCLVSLFLVLHEERRRPDEESVLADLVTMRRGRVVKELRPHPQTIQKFVEALQAMTATLLVQDKLPQAELSAREWLTFGEDKMPDSWETCDARAALGECLLRQKRFAEAEPLLLAAHGGMKRLANKTSPDQQSSLTDTIQLIVDLFTATGKHELAAEWKKSLPPVQPPNPPSAPR